MAQITKKQIQAMFDQISSELNRDISQKKMLRGYFFVGKDLERLEKLKNYLEEQKYKPVELFESEDTSGEYILQMSKIETHNVNSLEARNQELYQLVEDFGIDSYDGIDVGLMDED